MVAGSVFDVLSLSGCSAGILVDRPYQLLSRSRGNRLNQGQEDCHEAQ